MSEAGAWDALREAIELLAEYGYTDRDIIDYIEETA